MTEVPMEAVIEKLSQRIAALELDNAVLRVALEQANASPPQPEAATGE